MRSGNGCQIYWLAVLVILSPVSLIVSEAVLDSDNNPIEIRRLASELSDVALLLRSPNCFALSRRTIGS